MNNLTFIKSAETEQTGGGVMNDIIILDDGTCIVIDYNAIGYYKNYNCYADGIEPIKLIDRY
jgi:hypothetical protein